MTLLDRRRFLGLSALGSLSVPVAGLAAGPMTGFTHDVASGEPAADSVLLWTRYVHSSGAARLQVEVSEEPDFSRIAGGGSVEARAERDHVAKLTVGGLQPGRWYSYRFIAPGGERSPVGRTRTLPVGDVASFALGVFSCSNLPFGFFNAYRHAALRDDIDLMVHLGDYLYEYPRSAYSAADKALTGRLIDPATETIHLADYRARFASYRRDPDLRALHRKFPMIAVWDDHEIANDSYADGAGNHDPATEGDWPTRKHAAVQAYREWMPVSDHDWAEYRIGELATLFRLEERLNGRTRQSSIGKMLKSAPDPVAALTAFRDNGWRNPAQSMLGAAQEQWLAEKMRVAARETRWQLLAQQVNVGFNLLPDAAPEWIEPDPGKLAAFQNSTMAKRLGLPFNMDNWNGYPEARSRLLQAALEADANLVVLAGDSHNAWAFDLAEGNAPAAVEFGVQSVTSPGFEREFVKTDPKTVAAAFLAASTELRWAETARRGYMTIALTPPAVTAEWLFLDTVLRPSVALADRRRISVGHGRKQLSL